jgi:hypothetical protein
MSHRLFKPLNVDRLYLPFGHLTAASGLFLMKAEHGQALRIIQNAGGALGSVPS